MFSTPSANNLHDPVTTIIALENTISGTVMPLEDIKEISKLAKKHDMRMHLDGARLWNACVATYLE
jgi:threonine aldolase